MFERGKVIELDIANAITFNENIYTKAWIEIDHVNHGLNLRTKKLNSAKRSDFAPEDVCEFLVQLDGMDISPGKVIEDFSYFALEVLCPIEGIHFGKRFRLVFTTTLYRVR